MKRLLLLALLGSLVTLAQVKLPPHSRQTLPNGLVTVLSPKHDVPLITLSAVVRGGNEADPAPQAGLADLTAELLRRGTATRTAEQVAQELDFIGAEFRTAVDNQSTTVSIEFLAKDTDRALELFLDALLHPAFPETEFKKARDQKIAAAKALKDEPNRIIPLYSRTFFFGRSHPYGHPADELSLATITRDQVIGYHKQLYTAKNIFLVGVGDFTSEALFSKLRDRAASLPSGSMYAWKVAPAVKFSQPGLLVIDKPGATQTYFSIAQPGIHYTHPDRVALMLVNTLFGGRFTSILNDELRVNSGLTYGASSRIQQDRLTGALSIVTFTKTETTAKAIDLAVSLLGRLREQGVSSDQLQSAKAYVKGIFPTESLETADQLAHILGLLELYNLNRGEIDDLFSRIDALTPEQATEVARKYFRSDNLQFTLIGNAAKIKADVAKYAPSLKTITIAKPGIRPLE